MNRRNVAIPALLVAVLFISLGSWLVFETNQISEVTLDYTNCETYANSTLGRNDSTPGSISAWSYDNTSSTCILQFVMEKSMPPDVQMYIRLTNFYQNHALYLASWDANQLRGDYVSSASSLSSKCGWLQYANCDVAQQKGWKGRGSQATNNPDCMPPEDQRDPVIRGASREAQYYPCGLVANSMFTDSFSDLNCITGLQNNTCASPTYSFSQSDIAWKFETQMFGISEWFTDARYMDNITTMLIPPPQWRKHFPQWSSGYNATNFPQLQSWEQLHVWMSPAGLPTFRKLWGRNKVDTLTAAIWQVSIVNRFDVIRFGGTKSLVFATSGALGTRDTFTGVAFLVIGCISAAFAIFVLMVQIHKPGEHADLSWNIMAKSR